MKSTRELVEEWVTNAPIEIELSNFHIREVSESLQEFGFITHKVVNEGYTGCIDFKCKEWE